MATTLFAGHPHPVVEELIRLVRGAEGSVAIASSRHGSVHQTGEGTLHVPWTPRSSLSAKAACTHVRNAFGGFTECVFTFAPEACRESLTDMTISRTEQYIDENLRAPVFFVREGLSLFADQTDAVVSLVLVEDADTVYAPVEHMVRSGIYGFAESLAAQYRSGSPAVYAFSGSAATDQARDFAAFCHTERGDRARGRVQRFGRKGSLRGLFK